MNEPQPSPESVGGAAVAGAYGHWSAELTSAPPMALLAASAVPDVVDTPWCSLAMVDDDAPAPAAGAALAVCEAKGLLMEADDMPAPTTGAFATFCSFLTRLTPSDATPAMGAVEGAMGSGAGRAGRSARGPDIGWLRTVPIESHSLPVLAKCFRANGTGVASEPSPPWSTRSRLFETSSTCFFEIGGAGGAESGAVASSAVLTRPPSRSARGRLATAPSAGADSTPHGLSSNIRFVDMCVGLKSEGAMSWAVRSPWLAGLSGMAIDGTKGFASDVVMPTAPPSSASAGRSKCFFVTCSSSGPPVPSRSPSIASPAPRLGKCFLAVLGARSGPSVASDMRSATVSLAAK
mmetsp:Transcript_2713/g.8344  ORF Transcript_2713/g.8344 Transcript_2713/m.8344 type:complete len:349 (+) Transcript_2713:55-1101(+)